MSRKKGRRRKFCLLHFFGWQEKSLDCIRFLGAVYCIVVIYHVTQKILGPKSSSSCCNFTLALVVFSYSTVLPTYCTVCVLVYCTSAINANRILVQTIIGIRPPNLDIFVFCPIPRVVQDCLIFYLYSHKFVEPCRKQLN